MTRFDMTQGGRLVLGGLGIVVVVLLLAIFLVLNAENDDLSDAERSATAIIQTNSFGDWDFFGQTVTAIEEADNATATARAAATPTPTP